MLDILIDDLWFLCGRCALEERTSRDDSNKDAESLPTPLNHSAPERDLRIFTMI